MLLALFYMVSYVFPFWTRSSRMLLQLMWYCLISSICALLCFVYSFRFRSMSILIYSRPTEKTSFPIV